MTRIEIKDLPKGIEITKEELKRIRGGAMSCFHITNCFATYFDSGDYSPDSEENLATLKVNVGRVEFK